MELCLHYTIRLYDTRTAFNLFIKEFRCNLVIEHRYKLYTYTNKMSVEMNDLDLLSCSILRCNGITTKRRWSN